MEKFKYLDFGWEFSIFFSFTVLKKNRLDQELSQLFSYRFLINLSLFHFFFFNSLEGFFFVLNDVLFKYTSKIHC